MRWTLLVLCAGFAYGQNFSEIRIERAAVGLTFAEGPVWSRENTLVFSDVPASKIIQWVPGKGTEPMRDHSNGASGNTFDAQGRLYTCEEHSRRVVRQDKKGHLEVLAERWEGKRLNAPNDIVVRHDGEIYFTDPAFGNQLDTRELDFFGVFHITRKGSLELVAKWKGRPNGIALSPNGKTLFATDSDERVVRAWDLDKTGAAANERVVVSKIEGVPGGIRVDEKGNLYIAAKALAVYSPEGKQLAEIPLPETPSNCAFGDPDFGALYVTARHSVFRLRIEDVKGSVQY